MGVLEHYLERTKSQLVSQLNAEKATAKTFEMIGAPTQAYSLNRIEELENQIILLEEARINKVFVERVIKIFEEQQKTDLAIMEDLTYEAIKEYTNSLQLMVEIQKEMLK